MISRPLGVQTNNVAEYRAVQFALEAALRLGAREVELVLDSKLVVEQLSGRWKVRNVSLMPIVSEIQRLLRGFDRWSARHEPRERNRAADALANLALDDPVTAAALEAGSSGAREAATPTLRARPTGSPVPAPGSVPAPLPASVPGCLICRGPEGDDELSRVEVWRDDLWRLTVSLVTPVPGFAYLEPHRHIPSILELDGEEAASLGRVLPAVARVLRSESEAERVYVYVFGERVEHLHFNLAPHRSGDPLRGGRDLADPAVPALPADALRAVADRISRALRARP